MRIRDYEKQLRDTTIWYLKSANILRGQTIKSIDISYQKVYPYDNIEKLWWDEKIGINMKARASIDFEVVVKFE